MKILIAPDKFKGSLTSIQVCQAIHDGLMAINPSFDIQAFPLADGGEGTSDLLTHYCDGKIISLQVHDPLFRLIDSSYGISKDGSTAFIEMAKASGLVLLKPEERNPMLASTIGTGEVIRDALERGVTKIILGVGGSATNDAGIGVTAALGMEFYSSTNEQLKPIGENLIRIASMNTANVHPRVKDVAFTLLCDVDNPLHGPHGAAHIFASQKGADEKSIAWLDDGLRHFGDVVKRKLHRNVDFQGAGAAGGLPAGLMALTDVTITSGIDYVIGFTGLAEQVQQADLVITGEGKIDAQTLSGKVVKGVADLAKKYRKPVVAFAGKSSVSDQEKSMLGLHSIITLEGSDVPEEEAFRNAFSVLRMRVESSLPGILCTL
ncbi:MAG: glycerate kinase [Cyclobacteriaceae bacterium]|nr:glycerate kinase [Cyclobacteriaceae bacterium]